jgi:plastocyanin
MEKRGPAILLTLLLSATAARAGTVSGKVTLVRDGKEQADASNTVVWIEGLRPGASSRAPTGAAGQMKSSSKRFQPRVIAVAKDSTVDFPNDDPIYHNVFSVSGANRFDLGLYRSGASKSRSFQEPGLVRVYCNIHPQMVGFVMVVDSDFKTVTGPDGSFRFDGVPPGAHVVKAWHEEGPETSQPVTVRASGDAPLVLRLDLSGYKPAPHKNKYGNDYPPNAEAADERY